MSRTHGFGVIGFGNRIACLVAELLKVCPGAELVAVCDPSPQSVDSARRLAPGVKPCRDLHELLDMSGVEHVLVGSPNSFHRAHAVAALSAGRHVFCEKPLATTLDDCLAIRDAVLASDKTFFFGLVLRYADLYTRVRKLLDEGHIGHIISLEFNETLGFNHGGYIHQDWRRFRAAAGTHILEKCCHDIDLVNWMVGSRARYAASFGGLRYFIPENRFLADKIGPGPDGRPPFRGWPITHDDPFTAQKDIVDHQVAILEFENGVRASFHTNCAAGIPERRMLLLGMEGAIRADLNTGIVECQKIGWDEPRIVYRAASSAADHFGADLQLVRAMTAWIVDNARPATSINHAVQSAVTCFGIDAALDERRVVDLAPMWKAAGFSA